MKKITTIALACAMIIASLCGCAQEPAEQPVPLPESYSLLDEGRVTSTKDQWSTGMCAAFSVIKASESSIITDGYADADIDLSEAQLFYYGFSYQDEKDAQNCSDAIYLPGDRTDSDGLVFRYGGYTLDFLNSFANGHGPVDESVVEFDTRDYLADVHNLHDAHESGVISSDMSGDYLLTDMNVFRGLDNDDIYQKASIDTIKQAIVNDGAVAASTAFAADLVRDTKEYTAFYAGVCNDNIFEYINHGITIIGWDDNFSRENYDYYKPENDGAWLVQNSMGTYFGDEGLYWSSYEEELAGLASLDYCPRDAYGDILYHDSLWLGGVIRNDSGDTVTANVFTLDEDCALKAVGVPTSAIDQPVVIRVFRNSDANCPDNGERVAEIETTIGHPGYHVVDLEKVAEFAKGDRLSIVITYKADENGENKWLGKVPVEADFPEEEKALYLPMFDYQFRSMPGQSFVVYENKWYDTSVPATAELFGLDVTLNNFGIKALMDKE